MEMKNENIAAILGTSLGKEVPEIVNFSDLAQRCLDYDDFTEKMAAVPEEELRYFGTAICGEKKKVNKLTGSIGLLKEAGGADAGK